MSRAAPTTLRLLFLCVCGACTSLPDERAPAARAAPGASAPSAAMDATGTGGAAAEGDAAAGVDAAGSVPGRMEAPSPATAASVARGRIGIAAGADAGALDIWDDPAFLRRFAESYLAETDIEPRLRPDEREHMLAVMEHIAAERMDEAQRLLEEKREATASAVFDFTLANVLFQREQLDAAAAAYRVAVDKFPKFRRAWKNLGLIAVRQNDFAAALPALTRVVELGGNDAITLGLLGFTHCNLGNHLAAESAYRMAAVVDPHTMDWQTGLARSLFEQKRYAEAATLMDHLIAGHPGRADLWLLQANAFLGLEQPLRAAENYELVDRLGGSTAESLNVLGDIYVNQELFEPAVDAYARALATAPQGSAQRAIRGAKAMTARGAIADTRQLLSRVRELRGDQLSAEEKQDLLKLQARLAVAEGAGEEEVRVLEEIVALDPLDGDALIWLGQHSARAGDVEKAIFWFERAAGIPGFEADAKVRHAQALVGQQRYTEALPLLRRAQAIVPRGNVQDYLEQIERAAKARS